MRFFDALTAPGDFLQPIIVEQRYLSLSITMVFVRYCFRNQVVPQKRTLSTAKSRPLPS